MQRYSRRKLAQGLLDLLGRHRRTDVVAKIAEILHVQKMTRDLDLFIADVAEELLKRHRELAVTVTTARDLPAKTMKALSELLQQRAQATTVTLTTKVDPSLKGGFIARSALGELDASVSNKLNKLKVTS